MRAIRFQYPHINLPLVYTLCTSVIHISIEGANVYDTEDNLCLFARTNYYEIAASNNLQIEMLFLRQTFRSNILMILWYELIDQNSYS